MARIVVAFVVALVTAGCSSNPALPGEIDGTRVGAMAERELEAANPRIAVGRLACPDLALEVGASVRCVRTSELSEGRVVLVNGTVEVTSRSSGGRLHVAMDDEASEFGVTGEQVATVLRSRYAGRWSAAPTSLDCPFMRGVVGALVTCRIVVEGKRRVVDVVVTSVDPASYRTTYVARHLRPAS